MTKTQRRITTGLYALLAFTVTLVVLLSGMTHGAPLGGYVGNGQSLEKEANVPTWTKADAKAFPACQARLPEGVIPAAVVVVHQDATVERMPFQAAWDATHNDSPADDLWVIGFCR